MRGRVFRMGDRQHEVVASDSQVSSAPEPSTLSGADHRPKTGLLKRFFLMEEPLEAARRATFLPGHPGWREFILGRSMTQAADRLGESSEVDQAVLVLRKEATLQLARSWLQRRGIGSGAGLGWDCFEASAESRTLLEGLSSEQLALVRHVCSDDGTAALLDVETARLPALREALSVLTARLSCILEADARSFTLVRVARARRIVLALLPIAAIVACIVLATRTTVFSRNLARHATVNASSRDPNNGVDPGRLVDGNLVELGFHTKKEDSPTVVLDLGKSERIRKIVVYNRFDCCQERSVPLTVSVSEDGVNYRDVGTRKKRFDVWKLSMKTPTTARMVRIRLGKDDYLHLSEVELF